MSSSIMDRFSVSDRVIIITGASSGLGRAFALGFAEAGAHVVLGARRVDQLGETARQIESLGGQVVQQATDVADPDACERLVQAAIAAFGVVDVLINNAGVGAAAAATRETPDHYRNILEVNLFGTYWMAQASARVMRPGSSIINVGSVLGQRSGNVPQAGYSSSKAALLGLTRDLAHQWSARKGIRVNTLVPGFFDSGMISNFEGDSVDPQVQRTAMGRLGDERELVASAIFLASDASSFVTGTSLVVDGGYLAG